MYVFINHYTRISKLNKSQADRDLNWQFKKHLNTPSVDDENCPPLQMSELLSAIKNMKDKGAAGPDNIPPSFLKLFDPLTHPGITIHIELIFFTWSLPTHLEVCDNHSITESWEIS